MCKIIRFVASLKNSFSNRMLHAVTSSVLSFSISLSTQLLHCRCVFIGPNIFKNELCIMNILCYGLYFLNVSNLLVDDQKIYILKLSLFLYYFFHLLSSGEFVPAETDQSEPSFCCCEEFCSILSFSFLIFD